MQCQFWLCESSDFPDFVDTFPDFSPILCKLDNLDLAKSQLSHGLNPPLTSIFLVYNFQKDDVEVPYQFSVKIHKEKKKELTYYIASENESLINL